MANKTADRTRPLAYRVEIGLIDEFLASKEFLELESEGLRLLGLKKIRNDDFMEEPMKSAFSNPEYMEWRERLGKVANLYGVALPMAELAVFQKRFDPGSLLIGSNHPTMEFIAGTDDEDFLLAFAYHVQTVAAEHGVGSVHLAYQSDNGETGYIRPLTTYPGEPEMPSPATRPPRELAIIIRSSYSPFIPAKDLERRGRVSRQVAQEGFARLGYKKTERVRSSSKPRQARRLASAGTARPGGEPSRGGAEHGGACGVSRHLDPGIFQIGSNSATIELVAGTDDEDFLLAFAYHVQTVAAEHGIGSVRLAYRSRSGNKGYIRPATTNPVEPGMPSPATRPPRELAITIRSSYSPFIPAKDLERRGRVSRQIAQEALARLGYEKTERVRGSSKSALARTLDISRDQLKPREAGDIADDLSEDYVGLDDAGQRRRRQDVHRDRDRLKRRARRQR